jgi:methylglyoxal synthase
MNSTMNSKMDSRKRIALVAHDNCKQDLVDWVGWNHRLLSEHTLLATGTTGTLIEEAVNERVPEGLGVEVQKLASGPLGGDQQLGALITMGQVDLMVFFWDPMEPQAHDVDVKALLRISVLYNIPVACNRSSADFLISSPLLTASYRPIHKDYSSYLKRSLPKG